QVEIVRCSPMRHKNLPTVVEVVYNSYWKVSTTNFADGTRMNSRHDKRRFQALVRPERQCGDGDFNGFAYLFEEVLHAGGAFYCLRNVAANEIHAAYVKRLSQRRIDVPDDDQRAKREHYTNRH